MHLLYDCAMFVCVLFLGTFNGLELRTSELQQVNSEDFRNFLIDVVMDLTSGTINWAASHVGLRHGIIFHHAYLGP